MTPHQHDQTIEDTLSALQSIETPPGFEQRVLRSLDERAAQIAAEAHYTTSAASGLPAWLSPASLGRRVALGAACALLLTAAIFTVFHHTPPRQVAITHAPIHGAAPQPVMSFVDAAVPRPLLATPARQHRAMHAHAEAAVLATQHTEDAVPLAPTPLTEQERLLQQIARHGDAAQIAMLNPDLVARQEAQSDAEFRQFFASTGNSIKTSNP